MPPYPSIKMGDVVIVVAVVGAAFAVVVGGTAALVSLAFGM